MSIYKLLLLLISIHSIKALPVVSLLDVVNGTESGDANSGLCNFEKFEYAIALAKNDLKDRWDPDQPCNGIDMEVASVSLATLSSQNLEEIIGNSTICSNFAKTSDYNITISELIIWVNVIRHSEEDNFDLAVDSSLLHLNSWRSLEYRYSSKQYFGNSICLFDNFGNHWCEGSDGNKRNAILCQKLHTNPMSEEQKYWKQFWMVTTAVVLGFTLVMLLTYLIYQKCSKRSTRDTFGATLFSR